ncbi:MAG: MFS transporter [Bacteroidetes bacterium]|nr:MFS transporter [Bacteroidota bacterium]
MNPVPAKKGTTLFIIFLTIFIDLLGFGIILPLLPTFSINILHISELTIGLIVGIFSLMQFLFNPVWGSLSDKFGRKPVLIISLTGSLVSNLLLAFVFSGQILSPLLFIFARAFAGVFAGNISAAQAAISDITPPEERSKGMGLISAAFSLGFVFGPSVGGILSENFGYAFPVLISAALSSVALVMSIFVFKETLPEEIRIKNRKEKKFRNPLNVKLIIENLANKKYGKYIIIFFIAVFSFSNIFGTYQLFAERPDGLALDQAQIGYLFSFMGIIGALVQIFLIRFVQKRFGEENTLVLGNFLTIFGLGLIGFSTSIGVLLAVTAVLSVGNGFNNTASVSLLSQNVSPENQGSVLGINQSLSAFARFLGPLWGGFVYQYLGYQYPFITGGIIMIFATFYTYKTLKRNSVPDPV